jgi:hypothetical protein
MSATEPAAPDDNTTLRSVLAKYAEAGFDGDFSSADGPGVLCHRCNTTSVASTVTMTSLRRLEGASDPADMMSVAAISCPACGKRGTLILGFGPNASANDAEVFTALQDRRGEDELPAAAAPDETSRN